MNFNDYWKKYYGRQLVLGTAVLPNEPNPNDLYVIPKRWAKLAKEYYEEIMAETNEKAEKLFESMS